MVVEVVVEGAATRSQRRQYPHLKVEVEFEREGVDEVEVEFEREGGVDEVAVGMTARASSGEGGSDS